MKRRWIRIAKAVAGFGAVLLASVAAAQARHQTPVPAQVRLAETAHALEVSSERLVHFTSRFVTPWDGRERRALRDLDRLARDAARFHEVVERRHFDARAAERSLDAVLRGYDRAARSLARTRMPRPVYGRFDRIGDLTDRTVRLTEFMARTRVPHRRLDRSFRAYAGWADRDDDPEPRRYARPLDEAASFADADGRDPSRGSRGRRRIDD